MDVEIADGCMSELKYGGPQGAAKVTMNSESHTQTEPFGFRLVGVGFSTFETLFLSHSLCHTHTHTHTLSGCFGLSAAWSPVACSSKQ